MGVTQALVPHHPTSARPQPLLRSSAASRGLACTAEQMSLPPAAPAHRATRHSFHPDHEVIKPRLGASLEFTSDLHMRCLAWTRNENSPCCSGRCLLLRARASSCSAPSPDSVPLEPTESHDALDSSADGRNSNVGNFLTAGCVSELKQSLYLICIFKMHDAL